MYNYYPGPSATITTLDLRIRSKLVSFVAKRDRTVQASYAKSSSGVQPNPSLPGQPSVGAVTHKCE